MSSDHFLGRRGAAVCLLVGPLVLAAANGLWGITTNRNDGADWVDRVQDSPALAELAENLVTVGIVMTVLALSWVTQHVALNGSPKARFFGSLAVIGHMIGLVFGGMSYAVRQLASQQDLTAVGALVERIYDGPEFTLGLLNPPLIVVGYLGLAVVAARSGVLPTWRAVGLGLTIAFPVGIISGATIVSIIAFAGLASAMAPFGLALLREGDPSPVDSRRPVTASG
jgi:hypothetical protein